MNHLLELEKRYGREGFRRIAGIDEAGRGPLAGPVAAAAVVFDSCDHIEGIKDSKKLSERQRENLFVIIFERALDVGVGISRQWEIDKMNILGATRLAMLRAVSNLRKEPDCLLIDGTSTLDIGISQYTVVGGDDSCRCIAGASIIAKVIRDRIMRAFDIRYPGYGFSRNKGYPTPEHLAAINKLGILPIHRKSFAPVRRVIENGVYSEGGVNL
jgi:ribonuclease HII